MPDDNNNKAGHVRVHLGVLLIYALMAVALTYPLILHITTHVPGDGRDDPPLVWNLWWVRYALLDLHTNPLACLYMFYPIGINLTFFTLTILNGMLSIPVQLSAGLVLSSNINMLGAYAVAGFGMYLLALDVLAAARRRGPAMYLAAFAAGAVYAFAPIKMIFASLGQFNMTSSQWLPLCVLYLIRVGRSTAAATERHTSDVKAAAIPSAGWLGGWPGSDRRGLRDALLAATFLLFTAYAEVTFASFLMIFLAVYLGYLLVTRRARLNLQLCGRLMALGATVVAGFWPILGSMLREMAVEGDYSLSAGWGFADIYVADLFGFFIPSHLHPLLGSWAQQATRAFSYTNFATIGFVALALAIVGLLARRRQGDDHDTAPAGFWATSALLYAVLSLGPVLHIAGQWAFNLDGLLVRLPLPFIILHYVPFIKANRYPSRLHVLVMLCLAVLVAYGVEAILDRRQRIADRETPGAERTPMNAETARGPAHHRKAASSLRDYQRQSRVHRRSPTPSLAIIAILVAAIVFEYLAVPLPLSDMRVPQVYRSIAQDNANAPVLQLPISWRNSFQFIPQKFTELPQNVNTVVMFQQFYQATHNGPILSGNTSRNPEFKFTYFLEAPVVRSIIALQEGRTLTPEQIAGDRSIIAEVLRFFGFKYIVIHPPLAGGPVEEYVRAVFPVERIAADAGLAAYRVIAPPAGDRLIIDMSSDLSRLYRAEGWGEPQQINGRAGRWSDRKQARLLLPLSGAGPTTITIELHGAAPGQPATILLNGRRIGVTAGLAGWERLSLEAPPGSARAGLNELVIDNSVAPLPASGGESAIGQTGMATAANIVAHSAGLDAGGDLGFAHIYVNGKDAIKGQRGINLAVIDPATGRVQQTQRFDLIADPGADARLLDTIKAVATGQIVALAIMDDASINFGQGSLAALRMIGAQADLQGRLRNSYAAIGVKGAAPGQALEQWAQGRPASVAVGAHVFGKGLGVAVSRVTVETSR